MQAFVYVFMYVCKYVCALWSSTQCDLHLFPLVTLATVGNHRISLFLSLCVSPSHGHSVSVCFWPHLISIIKCLILINWFRGGWKVANNCVQQVWGRGHPCCLCFARLHSNISDLCSGQWLIFSILSSPTLLLTHQHKNLISTSFLSLFFFTVFDPFFSLCQLNTINFISMISWSKKKSK